MSDEARTEERHERRTVIAYPNKDRRVAGQEISICYQCSEAWPCENARLRERVAELEAQESLLDDDVEYLMRRATALRAGLDAVYAEIAASRIDDDLVAFRALAALAGLRRDDDATVSARAALAGEGQA